MPSSIALLLTIILIVGLLWRDQRRWPASSPALWLPLVWIFFVSSKFLGQWLALVGLQVGGPTTMEDGSLIDAVLFLLLIAGAAAVVVRRGVTIGSFVRENGWLAAFFLYCLLSIAWSDFPFVALKRWVKVLGHPTMALIILSDQSAVDALRTVIRRSAILYAPLSVLCIKYYPWIGRGWDQWTGVATNHGISHNKNELGYACLFLGFGLCWNLLCARKRDEPARRREEVLITLGLLLGVLWLLRLSSSATSIVCLGLGLCTMLVLGWPWVSKRYFWAYALSAACVAIAADGLLGASEAILALLGRDATLTDRTEVWADLMAFDINPWIGTGFESFWLGPRLQVIWERWWWHPNQAHNGYIETYLNLGWVGLCLLAGVLASTFAKAHHMLEREFDLGRFRMAWLFVVLAYNYTEATFKGVHLVWTVFHIAAIDAAIRVSAAGQRHVARRAVRAPKRAARVKSGALARTAPVQ